MTMLEKVAMAIATGRGLEAGQWPHFRASAIAAVKAMREPTNAMMKAAVDDADDDWHFGGFEAKECWRAMIDSILSEIPEIER